MAKKKLVMQYLDQAAGGMSLSGLASGAKEALYKAEDLAMRGIFATKNAIQSFGSTSVGAKIKTGATNLKNSVKNMWNRG